MSFITNRSAPDKYGKSFCGVAISLPRLGTKVLGIVIKNVSVTKVIQAVSNSLANPKRLLRISNKVNKPIIIITVSNIHMKNYKFHLSNVY